jgi:mannosyltransferase OCH1-like enzyme
VIPKVFHVIWVGDPMPDHLAAYVQTWRDVHPDWAMIVWDEQRLDATLDRTLDLFRRADEITSHVGQFRSDVARYELLWRFGGVYVDCDFEAVRSIDPLVDHLDGATVFAAWETDGAWVNNAILGAHPRAALLDDVIDGLAESLAEHPTSRPNVQTGPQYLTPIVRRHASAVRLFPSAWFYPYLWNELDRQGEEFPDAYAIHHWDNARKRVAAHVR